MYPKTATITDQLVFDFALPFGGKLSLENRWVLLARTVPWTYVEELYETTLSGSDLGCAAKSGRIAFGALLIKERLGITDRETVAQIQENPYLQYFLGLTKYTDKELFDPSLMVHFRKRFTKDMLAAINDRIVSDALNLTNKDEGQDNDMEQDSHDPIASSEEPPASDNKGSLIMDATCTPADITYPTDLKLLNEAREKTEEIIDCMHAPSIGQAKKPRTYRQRARKEYLVLSKQKKPGAKKIRKAIRKQLGYVQRNLSTIKQMALKGRLSHLSKRLYRLVLVSNEVYRQQSWMYENRTHSIPDRIVNLYQPHIRPIVRGKAGVAVEFGAKISVSLVDGFSYVETLSWDPYNESGDLIPQAEAYRQRYGHYPKAIQADTIYRTRANRMYCQEHGIRLSGPPLGRPPKETETNKAHLKELKDQRRQDEKERQAIEGKFGQGKRRFTLSRIMAKLADTAEAVIMVSFIVMNLEKILKDLLFLSFSLSAQLLLCLSKPLQHPKGGEFYWPKIVAGFHLKFERLCRVA